MNEFETKLKEMEVEESLDLSSTSFTKVPGGWIFDHQEKCLYIPNPEEWNAEKTIRDGLRRVANATCGMSG